MTAEGGGWLAVPRLGRVEEAVGAALGAVRAARDRRRGMAARGARRIVRFGGKGRQDREASTAGKAAAMRAGIQKSVARSCGEAEGQLC